MEIPVYRRQQTIPGTTGGVPISPEKVKEPYLAEAQQGQAISKMGFEALDLTQKFQAAEKRAERIVEAQRLENTLKEAILDAKTEIDTTGDYKQYETLANTRLEAIKAQHIDSIQDPIVKRAAESVFITQSGDLKRHAKVQKIKGLTEESTMLFGNDYERAATQYANTTDEAARSVIKDTIRMKGLELEDAKTLKLGTTEKLMLDFDQKAEAVYAGQLINTNAEVAYSYLNERNKDGTYKNLQNLNPEKRIALINNAESGIRSQRVENERLFKVQQDDILNDILNKKINPEYPIAKLVAEIEALEQRKDLKTGERYISTTTAYSLKNDLLNGRTNKGDIAAETYWGDLIDSGENISSNQILSDNRLSDTQKRRLVEDIRNQKKAKTIEEKQYTTQKDQIYQTAKLSVDATFPNKGNTKVTNAALKSRLRSMKNAYQGADSVEKYEQWVDKTLTWAQNIDKSSRSGANEKLAKMLLGPDIIGEAAKEPIINNPLNIKAGSATIKHVESGAATVGRKATDGGRFLNFKTKEEGLNAAKDLLKSDVYSSLTVDAAMKKWSNKGYGGEIVPELKNKTITSLKDTEFNTLVSAMAKAEGNGSGVQQPNKVDKTSWLRDAKKTNPKTSDTELSAYFDKKYGGK